MRKLYNIISLVFIVSTLFTSCQTEEELGGEGKVSFKVSLNSDVNVVSRAAEEDYAANCTIYVYNSENLIRKYHGVSELPSELTLVSGDYKAVAWSGDSVAASFTSKYFKGYAPFTITKGSNVQTTIECKIANTVASVNFDKSVDEVLSNYKINIGNSKGNLDFDASNAAANKGYYMMPDGETDLVWEITGTQADGSPYSQKGSIPNVKRTTEYAMTIKYNHENQDFGGAFLTITVDESTIDIKDDIVLKAPPKFIGSGFNINDPFYSEQGSFKNVAVYATAATSLTHLEVSCDYFSTLGFPANSFDFFNMTAETTQAIANLGLTNTYSYNSAKDESISKVMFSKELMNKLPNGSYKINFKVTDVDGKVVQKTLNIEISDASVITLDPVISDIHQYSTTIHANIIKEDATNFGFNYRKSGATEWQSVSGVVSGTTYSAKLTGLSPNTTYQYVAKCDGYTSSKISEFTTGNVIALVNGGFESWFTDSDNALVPATSNDALFWDSGNHGSMTCKVNVTTPDSEIKHSGNYSIKLSSSYPTFLGIGKFAAGNVFVGKYLRTDGTNGVLGFGRPFNARPKALHGYVKYTPGAIDNTNSEVPEATSGSLDHGIIYVALLDGTSESDNGSNWPLVIKTKKSERRLFSKNDSKVIGYGEMVWSAATSGMIEFTIPIDYNSTVTPANILIVASASKWGDYFVGSTSSTMWIDDLELVYE